VPGAAVTAVLAVLVGLVAVKLSATPARPVASESQASSAVVRQVITVPAAVLTRVSPGQEIIPLQTVKTSGPPLTIGGKPAIVFVSEESCPFCAAERWSLAVALSHFGTWSHLGSTTSSATDVYPNTATLSFRTAVYHSTELTLRTTELADNAGHPLQAQSPLDTRLIGAFDVPPYVNSADQPGAVPFLDIANRYILTGAQYNPQVLAGLSAAQIASQLSNPSSPVAQAIDGSAQVIIATLDQILHASRPRYEHRAYPAAETRPSVLTTQAQQPSRNSAPPGRAHPSGKSDYQIEWPHEDHDRNRGIAAFLGPARCRRARGDDHHRPRQPPGRRDRPRPSPHRR